MTILDSGLFLRCQSVVRRSVRDTHQTLPCVRCYFSMMLGLTGYG